MNNKMICRICEKQISSKGSAHITRKHQMTIQEYYDQYLKTENEGVCKECGKSTRFQNITLGYCSFCSRNCSNQNEYTKQKIQKSFLKKFGDNPNRTESIKIKKEKTFFKNWNVSNCSKSDKIKDKKKQTYLKHYGVDHYSQSSEGRMIHRLHHIKLVENQKLNGDPLSPMIGYQEKSFLDELQKYIKWNIIRNDSTFKYGIARYPDGHIYELRLFIQFDERFHFKDRYCKKYHEDDIRCTLELASLGYIVFRVSERRWKKEKQKVIQEFMEIVKWREEQQ